jgi:hypothetical protein
MNQAETQFREHYITSAEVCRAAKCSRNAIHKARERGALPDGFQVGAMFVWLRKESAPYVKQFCNSVRKKAKPT